MAITNTYGANNADLSSVSGTASFYSITGFSIVASEFTIQV